MVIVIVIVIVLVLVTVTVTVIVIVIVLVIIILIVVIATVTVSVLEREIPTIVLVIFFLDISRTAQVVLTFYLSPVSVLLIAILIPITVWVQYSRRHTLTALLDTRQRAERQYVSSMADVIENVRYCIKLAPHSAQGHVNMIDSLSPS